MIWQPLLLLSLVRPGLPQGSCGFRMVVNSFDALGGDRELFFRQHSLKSQHEIFKELVDSAIDPNDRDAHYLGFPYYLKITLACAGQLPPPALSPIPASFHFLPTSPSVIIPNAVPMTWAWSHVRHQPLPGIGGSSCCFPSSFALRLGVLGSLCLGDGAGVQCWEDFLVQGPSGCCPASLFQDPARAMRRAHYTGFIPIVTIEFEEPVHSVRQKPEQLEIEMKAAPYRFSENCDSEELCLMCWYTPMPIMNGSVVMSVTVRSNNHGFHINSRRSFMNINGYVKETHSGPEFSIGERLSNLKDYFSLNESSRPLWFTLKQAPVHILGGIPKSKVILLSDTGFDDYFIIEVAIDSCWISSRKCPWDQFSSSLYDAIATESTLFVRQNQLVYYFTGNYSALYMNTSGSELWTRILAKQCVRKLNPVDLTKNNTEYVIALGGGWHEGEFFLITVSDGIVKHAKSSRKSACTILGSRCILNWVMYDTEKNCFFLLVQTNLESNASAYFIMAYHQAIGRQVSFTRQTQKELLCETVYMHFPSRVNWLILGPLRLKAHQVAGKISNDLKNYLYLSDFPSHSAIKYFVQSFFGELACVTEDEQVWISHEGSSIIRKIYPSRAWELNKNLQMMGGSAIYQRRESRVTVFFDRHNLLEGRFGRGGIKAEYGRSPSGHPIVTVNSAAEETWVILTVREQPWKGGRRVPSNLS
ncbi:UNVERIFIED_CONTAM: hypothetical protein K2H54_035646 [Gekko kuhli]